MFVYELSGCGFQSSCCHLNFKFRSCFEQGVPWYSGNYRVWIHSETIRDMNITYCQNFACYVLLRIIFLQKYDLSAEEIRFCCKLESNIFRKTVFEHNFGTKFYAAVFVRITLRFFPYFVKIFGILIKTSPTA